MNYSELLQLAKGWGNFVSDRINIWRLPMSQINHIKDLSNCGYRISEISKKTGADPKTIRKYLAQDDFSPQPSVIQEKPSKLDPFKPIIQE